MYDYATIAKQNQIISELNSLNQLLSQGFTNLYYLLIVLIIAVLTFGIYKYVMKCLGK